MFWRNLTKIGHIYIPYKFAQSGCIPPKIKCEILAHKGSLTTHNRTTGPPSIHDDGSRFPGKSNPLQTRFFFILIAQWSIKEDNTIISKIAKGKEKSAAKMEKTAR